MGWFTFKRATQMPTPGAMEYGLVTELLADRPYIGPAIGFSTQMRNFAAQNSQFAAMAALTGVGGLVHGQSALQPLSDPYNSGTPPSTYSWDTSND